MIKPKINLQEGEQILFECQPKTTLIGYIFLRSFLIRIIIFTIIIFQLVIAGRMTLLHVSPITLLLGGFITASTLSLCWIQAMLRKYWYFFTNQRCVIYSGFWGINRKIVPYNRITEVDMNRNFLRDALGFSAVYLSQPGMTFSGPSLLNLNFRNPAMMVIDGITHEQAEGITDLVSKHMSAVVK